MKRFLIKVVFATITIAFFCGCDALSKIKWDRSEGYYNVYDASTPQPYRKKQNYINFNELCKTKDRRSFVQECYINDNNDSHYNRHFKYKKGKGGLN